SVTFSGNITSGSTTITGLSSTQISQLRVGGFVSGTGIPTGTTVASVTNTRTTHTVTLSAPATATVQAVKLNFGTVANNSGWGQEEALDVEWAHAIAPQANIVLVEATSSSYSALFSAVDWATNNGAHIVSMSWGGGDWTGESVYDSHFNHAGVTY